MRSWLALGILAWSLPARGEEAIRVQYEAPEGCPASRVFADEVRQRTSRGRWAEPEELARTFAVTLTADATGFVGRVEFLDESGGLVSRSVRGEQCEAVVSSLALITALALDATRGDQPSSSPPLPPPPDEPLAPALTRARAVEPRPPPARRGRRTTARAVTSVRIGVAGGYAGAVHAPRLGVLGQLDFRGGPVLRLTAHYGWDDFVADPEGRRAKLRVLGVETSLCPWRYELRALAFAPCVLVDLGALRVGGVRDEVLTSAGSDTILWASTGAEVRLGWEPRESFWAEGGVAAIVPLRQGYRFTFENPEENAYEVPPVAVSAGLSGGVRFW